MQTKFLPKNIEMKIMGRHFVWEERLYLTYSGSEVGFYYDGEHLEADLYADKMSIMPTLKAGVAVYVGDEEEPFRRSMLSPGTNRLVLFDRGEYARRKGVELDTLPKQIPLHVVKLSEAAFAALAIEAFYGEETDHFAALPRKELQIEYIGDSITCGYGVEGIYEQDEFTTAQENPCKAFSLQSAKKLGADYQLCAWSGIGVISKYIPPEADEPDTEVLIQEIYPYVDKKLQERMKLQPAHYDFQQFIPDIVVLNIGTNDASYTREKPDREAHYAQAMKAFIHMIHEKNPKAKVIVVYGVMDQTLCPVLEKLVSDCRGEGADYLYYLPLPLQLDEDGIGADWHPSATTHGKAADRLVEFITEKREKQWRESSM